MFMNRIKRIYVLFPQGLKALVKRRRSSSDSPAEAKEKQTSAKSDSGSDTSNSDDDVCICRYKFLNLFILLNLFKSKGCCILFHARTTVV